MEGERLPGKDAAPGPRGSAARTRMSPSGTAGRKGVELGLFRREITIEAEPSGEKSMAVTASLRDTRQGTPIHVISVRAEIGLEDGRIHSLEGEMPHIPHEDCRETLKTLQGLVGEPIAHGFTRRVREVVGSPSGCFHLAVLVTNLGNVSVQGRSVIAMSSAGDDREESRTRLLDLGVAMGLPGGCYAWREDGPFMRSMRKRGLNGNA